MSYLCISRFENDWFLKKKINGSWQNIEQGPPEGRNYGPRNTYIGGNIIMLCCPGQKMVVFRLLNTFHSPTHVCINVSFSYPQCGASPLGSTSSSSLTCSKMDCAVVLVKANILDILTARSSSLHPAATKTGRSGHTSSLFPCQAILLSQQGIPRISLRINRSFHFNQRSMTTWQLEIQVCTTTCFFM